MNPYDGLTETEAETIESYKEALRVLAVVEESSDLQRMALTRRNRMADVIVSYKIKCMLCDNIIIHRVPVPDAAEFIYPPRGICGRHNEPVIADAAILETSGG